MRILAAEINNFGSYKHLKFDFDNRGVVLVYGLTGCGKSTLQDIPQWILYGTTAKGGKVDDVKQWNSECTTNGTLTVDVCGELVSVTRIRGKPQENDLFWEENGSGIKMRGKDLLDTQKLLNEKLGMSSDLFRTMVYFNEFSQTGLFFLLKAKDRRNLLQSIVSMKLPVDLSLKIQSVKKNVMKTISDTDNVIVKESGQLEQLQELEIRTNEYANHWEIKKVRSIEELQIKSKNFDKEKAYKIDDLNTKSYRFESDRHVKTEELVDKLDFLDEKIKSNKELDHKIFKLEKKEKLSEACSKCGQSYNTKNEELELLRTERAKNTQYLEKFSDYSAKLREVQSIKNPYAEQIKLVDSGVNTYDYEIKKLKESANPFNDQKASLSVKIESLKASLNANVDIRLILRQKCDSLNLLNDLTFELRAELLRKTVSLVEKNVNYYIEKYFDSEFKVSFLLENADDLEVEIQKNGYFCSYNQLSKGQRQILKLCLSVSLMIAASNNSGVSTNIVCFDEALDGFDSELKIKSYSLFQELSSLYDSIFLVDHSEDLKQMFTNRYSVRLVADESQIEYES